MLKSVFELTYQTSPKQTEIKHNNMLTNNSLKKERKKKLINKFANMRLDERIFNVICIHV